MLNKPVLGVILKLNNLRTPKVLRSAGSKWPVQSQELKTPAASCSSKMATAWRFLIWPSAIHGKKRGEWWRQVVTGSQRWWHPPRPLCRTNADQLRKALVVFCIGPEDSKARDAPLPSIVQPYAGYSLNSYKTKNTSAVYPWFPPSDLT